MSRKLSLAAVKRDPGRLLALVRDAAPAPLFFAGTPDPLPKGYKKRERLHVPASDVEVLQSLGEDQLRLHLGDGSRLLVRGISLGQAVKRLNAAGYRFEKPHSRYAAPLDRVAGIAIDREELPAPSPTRTSPPELDLSRLQVAIEPTEGGASSVHLYDPLLVEHPGIGDLQATIFEARRYELLFPGPDNRCPIGPGDTETRVVETLATRTAPVLQRLDRPMPESRYAAGVRKEGLVTVGGPAFWSLVMDPGTTDEARAAWVDRWTIHNLPLEEALELFRYAGEPRGATEPKHWIDKERAIQNIIWQVHQWKVWGLIDSIKQDVEGPGDAPWEPPGGGDGDDWWDDPGQPDDPDRRKPNIRTLWYRYVKGALKSWGIHTAGDDESFGDQIKRMARDLELFRYRDFDFKDVLRRRRKLGERRPHLLVVAEKAGMEALAVKFAERVSGSYLILSGEPPKITMEYLTEELIARMVAGGELSDQEVHVFGLVDFNAAGANILRSVREDLEHYAARLSGSKLRAVHAHNLVHVEDMSDELIEDHRTAQVHYVDEHAYSGGKKIVVRRFHAGNPSRLTVVKQWFEEHVRDERFREVIQHVGKLEEAIYYGLEVDDHPEPLLMQRFKDIVVGGGLLT